MWKRSAEYSNWGVEDGKIGYPEKNIAWTNLEHMYIKKILLSGRNEKNLLVCSATISLQISLKYLTR